MVLDIPVLCVCCEGEIMLRKKIIIIIPLILSFCLNVVLLVMVLHKHTDSIVGTYCTGEGFSENDKYIVFQQDSSYMIYSQFNVIEEGKYNALDTDANIFSLISNDKASEHLIVYNQPDGICLVEDSNNIINFTRISKTPTFINLQNR